MVQGVPAIGVMMELIQLCALYGVVEEYRPLDEYPAEEFTEVYLVKFQKLTSARAAKRHMDEKSFYGGVLHVCYVPEYETVEDTRLKLQDRRNYIRRVSQQLAREKEQNEAADEEQTPSNPVTTSEKIIPRCNQVSHTGKTANTSHSSGFPLLPLPPKEHHPSRKMNTHTPTEDKMGTLHNAIITPKQQAERSREKSSNRDQDGECSSATTQASAVRFVPRNTLMENRKRKAKEANETGDTSGTICRQNELFIGPKLPEPFKQDMEDESLNTTVNLIRNTLKQVGSVPDLKLKEKKVKPRRRI